MNDKAIELLREVHRGHDFDWSPCWCAFAHPRTSGLKQWMEHDERCVRIRAFLAAHDAAPDHEHVLAVRLPNGEVLHEFEVGCRDCDNDLASTLRHAKPLERDAMRARLETVQASWHFMHHSDTTSWLDCDNEACRQTRVALAGERQAVHEARYIPGVKNNIGPRDEP